MGRTNPETASNKAGNAVLLAQAEAVRAYPELGRSGSAFNLAFLARVSRARMEKPLLFTFDRWPIILANEVADAGIPAVGTDSFQLPSSQRQLLPSSSEWQFLKVYRDGDDIVVPHAVATVFGHDTELNVRDPQDSGRCASGRGTLQNPGLLGCALPVSGAHRSTAGSAFAKLPNLPWFSSVIVTHAGRSITVELVDNGPSAPGMKDPVPAGIDLTPAACIALGISIDDIRNNRAAFDVSYRLPGAGRQMTWPYGDTASATVRRDVAMR